MRRILFSGVMLLMSLCVSGADVISEELWCNRDGMNIYGVMYRPEGAGKVPVVILSHSSSLTHAAMAGYAERLAAEGYAAYCFDFCGGSSESKSDGSTDDMTVFTEMDDLRAVINDVKRLDYVDADRVVLLGSSQGGLVSALLAETMADEVDAMVLFYPAFNIPELVRMFEGFGDFGSMGDWGSSGMGGMMTMSETYVNAIKDYDVWANIGTYPHPVCIVHGTSDIIVPISNSEKAVELYPDAVLHSIEGANHGFNEANLGSMGSMMGGGKDYDDEVMPIVFAFLKENVPAGIASVVSDDTTSGIRYNIQGMRIDKPAKGMLYIEDGKKRTAR